MAAAEGVGDAAGAEAEARWLEWMRSLSPEDAGHATREFCVHYYFFSLQQIVAFAKILGSLPYHDRAGLGKLAETVFEELGDGARKRAHSRLFEKFLTLAGAERPKAEQLPGRVADGVRAYVDALANYFGSGHAPTAVGAYVFLEESAVAAYPRLLELFREQGYADEALEFFVLHATIERDHAATARELAAAFVRTEEDRAAFDYARERLAQRWAGFWQGIQEACESALSAAREPATVTGGRWRSDAVFRLLCDLVASDRLLCLTGAGISARLPRQGGGGRVPDWPTLLRELSSRISAKLGAADRKDVEYILEEASPPGSRLILAASILRAADPNLFDVCFRAAVTVEPDQFSDTHAKLLGVWPRGIMTFNYDGAHEAAARHAGVPLQTLLPHSELLLRQALAQNLPRTFLLKAHGSLGSPAGDLVLSAESYRDLMVHRPAYRAFVRHVLSELHLVIVGFRLSDPDFEEALEAIFNSYGAPIRESVLILHRRELSRREVELRRRYDIHTLVVDDFAEVPALLEAAAQCVGPKLQQALETAQHAVGTEARSQAHDSLRALGPSGLAMASRVLRQQLEGPLDEAFVTSERAYCLGVLSERLVRDAAFQQRERERNKQALMALVEREKRADPIGRALTVLRGLLSPADLPKLREWALRFARPLADERIPRLEIYCRYLEVYVQAKHRSEPGGAGSSLPFEP